MSTTNFSLIFRLLNLYLKFSNQSQSNWGFYSYNKKTLDKLESLSRGYVLTSQAASHQVLSALKSLTSVFGMGTGVSSLL